MTKQQSKQLLKWTLIIVAALQMPQVVILPGTNLVATEVFPQYPIQTIQTIMASPGVVSVICSILAGVLLRCGIVTKKSMTVLGLGLIAMAGVSALIMNSHIWQLLLMNFFIGAGAGIYVPSSQSIMFDTFDDETRRFMAGFQFSVINAGGLILSILCGMLITYVWYAGHVLMLVAVPLMLLALIIIPGDKRIKPVKSGGVKRTKMPARAYYYAFIVFIYIVLYSVATINISTHIEQGGIGDPSTAGIATALIMGGPVVSGYILPALTKGLRDHVFSIAMLVMAIAFSLLGIFHTSLVITYAAMFIFGMSMSLIVPRSIYQAANLSDPTNSSTITVLVCTVSAGVGNTVSPLIITNLTLALGGESTRFRFLFSAGICVALAVILLFCNLYLDKRLMRAGEITESSMEGAADI